ncbi:hypothetical protein KCP70_01365 [Salmonella enterica subsp. enterica]|nr:hypothetical protein KCP70_01365 [Salmonella enterica subsp. enterica]
MTVNPARSPVTPIVTSFLPVPSVWRWRRVTTTFNPAWLFRRTDDTVAPDYLLITR